MITIIILIISGATTALMAGLFFAWSVSVTPGIKELSDREYIVAMQSMNRAIQNPMFFACFFGTAVLLPLSTYLHYGIAMQSVFWLLLSSSFLYLLGVMGVTIFGNVPLNESLDAFDLQSSSDNKIAAQRSRFEVPWNRLNTIRTVTSAFAIALFIVACIIY